MEMKAHFHISSSTASLTGVQTFPARGHSTLSEVWHVGSMWTQYTVRRVARG